MKNLLAIIILLFSISLHAQETDKSKWFHLEGVTNPGYKVYMDQNIMKYEPGKIIEVRLKYDYTSKDSLINSIFFVKYFVDKDTYLIEFEEQLKSDSTRSGRTESEQKHLIPGSEMSVIYQGVYIQAVSNYRPKSD